MFARITEFQKDGQKLQYVNERFEYFHHYWTLFFLHKRKEKSESRRARILLTPDYLFLEKVKLESHRSLFVKINKQLNHNYPKAKDKLRHLFIDHPYFSATENILIRSNPGLVTKVANIKQVLSTTTGSDFKNEQPQKKQQIIESFELLESQLLRRYPYEKRLSNQLYKVLSRNKPLTYQDKEDIKFLVNAFIVEFYYYGYSEDYIEKVPDIITLRNHIEYFPFEKKRYDFNSRNDFEQYVWEEDQRMTTKMRVSALSKLLNARKYTGYVIFKIEGVSIEESIQLQGVEFYNPQIEQKVSKREYSSDEPELFIQEKASDESNPDKANQASTCNAIVEVSFLSPDKLNGFQTIMEAYREVESSVVG